MTYDEQLRRMPLWQITVGEFLQLTQNQLPVQTETDTTDPVKRYVHGLKGLQDLLGVSHTTAQKIKNSGKINGCYSEIGRKLIFDADAVLTALKPNAR